MSQWYGVTVNADGRVTELDLGHNNLTGSIPPNLGSLSQLQVLHFNGNYLSDTIPPELGNLTQLNALFLSDNLLAGQIPVALGELDNLIILQLSNNQFSGTIPPEFGDSINLRELQIGGNQFTGCIPQNLDALKYDDFDESGLPFCSATSTHPLNGDRVYLVDGYLNGEWIDPLAPSISVSPGQAIDGYIILEVHNDHDASAAFPVEGTPTWGDHQSSFGGVPLHVPAYGSAQGDASISLIAPDTPGEYAFIFVAQAELPGGYVASATHWFSGPQRWNNGDDVASWSSDQIDFAIANGYVIAPQYGWGQPLAHFGAAAVKILVSTP